MTDFWRRVADHLRRGEKVFLALVVEHTRHSPGTTGARLFVTESGELRGTVGGGVMEHRLIERAREALSAGRPLLELETLHHRRRAEGKLSGMICAGSQSNLYLLCAPGRDGERLESLVTPAEGSGGASGEACPVLEITPAGLDVYQDSPRLDRPARELVRDGEAWRYREELFERRRLAIFGGGHCALALARLARELGYRVEVVEAKKSVAAGLAEIAEVHRVDDFIHGAEEIPWPALTPAVVLTTDVAGDVRALEGILRRPFPFVGVMGSAAKLVEIERRLRAAGSREDDLARLRAPVGLAIGSRTPPEIAVSIAAELIAWQSERS